MEDYSPEFLNWIQSKRAEGYDFVTDASQINKDRQTIGLRTPTGEITNQRTAKVGGFGDFFKEFVLPSFAAYGAVNFLGPRLEGLTNALSGGGQLSAADLANIPTGTMGQASQSPALGAENAGAMYTDISMAPGTETGLFGEQFHPSKIYPYSEVTLNTLTEPVTSVTTPAAQLTDAASAVQLRPLTQLQPITLAGEPYLTAGAGGGASATAAANALSPAVGLSAEALDAALAGAGGGAGAGTVGATGGSTALSSGGFLRNMSETAATEGAGVAGTGILTKGTNIPSAVLGGGNLVDRALNLIKTPAGQAVLGGVGSAVGGVLEANAAEQAAETQSQAAQNALALQREMFEYQKGLLEPYRTAGTKALDRLSGAMGLGGPGSQQQMLEMDPGYGFRLGEGLKALERLQASRGNFLSGGALKAGQRFAQDTASQEYGNAYNRLANIAGLGQTAGTQMGGAAAGFGTSAGNIMGQEANALAAGRMGRASAYTGAIGGALGSYQNYLNRQQEERLVRDIFGRTTVGG
jgi:hypothetical protein